MNLCETYLLERGLSLDFAAQNGVELDLAPDEHRVRERLGDGCVPIWRLAQQIIWFSNYDAKGVCTSCWARPLPTLRERKFLRPIGDHSSPYIPRSVYGMRASVPLVITEGPVKALALAQAGLASAGVCGVWCSDKKLDDGKLTLSTELRDLGPRGRNVYICFDADAASNVNVRHASIRLFFLLSAAGAEVFQLTSWQESQAKGIDDYLVVEVNRGRSAQDILRELITQAQPFVASLKKSDLESVESEFGKVSLSAAQRDQLCSQLGKPLGVRTTTLRTIAAEKQDLTRGISFPDFEPWPEEVSGDALIQDMIDLIRRHIVLSDYGVFTAALWSLLCWFVDSEKIDTLPFLCISSPDKRCGKSRLQTVLEWFVPRALSTSNISAAAVYRTIEAHHPTLLMDEADTYAKENEELRGVLNSGHTREKAFVIRCHPTTLEPERFNVWCPKSLALIGDLPGTLADRSIVIPMERKKRAEKVKPLRATEGAQRKEIHRKILRWYEDNWHKMEVLDAPTAEEISDRDADNWLPVLQVAKLLGSKWYSDAFTTMRRLNPSQGEREDQANPTIPLLIRLSRIFQEAVRNSDPMLLPVKEDFLIATTELLVKLNADKEAPWADWRKGEGLSQEKLASLLRPFKVSSVQKRVGPDRVVRGYLKSQLQPIFDRYAPPDPEPETEPES